ncbi:hypothetical protein AS200_22090 [Streptomyces sp. CdTB01]|nr:hypothetical protein AS200_22090 [Streptomyces sp. CdTB01]
MIFTGVARALLPLNSAGARNTYDLVGRRFPTASGEAFPIFAAGCVDGSADPAEEEITRSVGQ